MAESSAVRVVDAPKPRVDRRKVRPWLSLLLLLTAVGITALLLSLAPTTAEVEHPDAIEAVKRLRDAVDQGSESDVRALLGEGAILTWPAGPPWGGPLSGSVELVTDPQNAQLLDHVARLADFLAFQQALTSETNLWRCNVYSRPPAAAPWLSDTLVQCTFSIESDLLRVLADDDVIPFGQMRFRVDGAVVTSVLVETWELRYSPIDFLTWIKEERPEPYGRIFSGRVTVPKYDATSAAEILDLATEYAALRE